jgi:hypothetical protein
VLINIFVDWADQLPNYPNAGIELHPCFSIAAKSPYHSSRSDYSSSVGLAEVMFVVPAKSGFRQVRISEFVDVGLQDKLPDLRSTPPFCKSTNAQMRMPTTRRALVSSSQQPFDLLPVVTGDSQKYQSQDLSLSVLDSG